MNVHVTATTCPVDALRIEHNAAVVKHRHTDDENDFDRVCNLQAMSSHIEATSIGGVAFQLKAASEEICTLLCSEMEEWQRQERLRRLDRLVNHALKAIVEINGLDRNDFLEAA